MNKDKISVSLCSSPVKLFLFESKQCCKYNQRQEKNNQRGLATLSGGIEQRGRDHDHPKGETVTGEFALQHGVSVPLNHEWGE